MVKNSNWDFFVDVGGTFTDCLGRSPDGQLHRAKVLSRGSLSVRVRERVSANRLKLFEDPGCPEQLFDGFFIQMEGLVSDVKVCGWDPKTLVLELDQVIPGNVQIHSENIELCSPWEAPILGMKLILLRAGIEPSTANLRMRLATTRCTNALLEKTGIKPVLFLTAGFPHLLQIGDQRRTELFDLVPKKRDTLQGCVVEVCERVSPEGFIEKLPQKDEIIQRTQELINEGHETAVISFLHSHLNPKNENLVASWVEKAGFSHVIRSNEIHPFINWLPRCECAVVEAYLRPILENYLDRIENELGENGKLLVMTSEGGLLDRGQYRAVDSLLSGPAGGVVGAVSMAGPSGAQNFINLDMGGTSTDVSRYSDGFSRQSFHCVGDARITGNALHIETIAAGGGSICQVVDGLLRVGPSSAGSFPGPACYGFGGPFCLTDINLLLGRLDPNSFSTPLNLIHSELRLAEMVEESGKSARDLLDGFIAIADDAMANAIRKVSIEQGYDPMDHSLVAFGGAGGQHACGVAKRLGITKILSPADSGLLSAFGLSRARIERTIEHPISGLIEPEKIRLLEKSMRDQGISAIAKAGDGGQVIDKSAKLRLIGQEATIEIDYTDPENLDSLFRKKFVDIFGYFPKGKDIEMYSLLIRVTGGEAEQISEEFPPGSIVNSSSISGEIFRRNDLNPGDCLIGPCLLVDNYGALWIDSDWQASMGTRGTLSITDISDLHNRLFPIHAKTELFTNRFLCLVEEMGVQLERTALSVNVRERLDFSCALLDGEARLVVNAPHIPVHLGAMGLCVRRILERIKSVKRGDILVSNHPGFGGSHLPDITLVMPIWGKGDKPVAYLANRAHHAEIGGIVPGSMPANAHSLEEEGVVIHPMHLFKEGESKFSEIELLLSSATFPSRQVDINLADLHAQVASLRLGADQLFSLIEDYGDAEISLYLSKLTQESSTACRDFVNSLKPGKISGEQILDDGSSLTLELSVKPNSVSFDFSGSSCSQKSNLNAPEAIVYSSLSYCLRVIIGCDLPLNEGLLDPLRINISEGSILKPIFSEDNAVSPGVAGGNVEVSQRLTDLIFSLLGEIGCSQGTMNNLTFGNDDFSHYETIGGGSGAMVGLNGTSAVQVHMTNTAITDPEILETRFPVRLLRFAIRENSGGTGQWRGGDGIEREYLFNETMHLSILSQRRKSRPDGILGGGKGLAGEQILVRSTGERIVLKPSETISVKSDDRLILRTPGGGGAGEELS